MLKSRPSHTVQHAKSRLSSILKDVRSGKPQFIGRHAEFVVLTSDAYQDLLTGNRTPSPQGIGQKLLSISPGIDDFQLPERGPDRNSPFTESGLNTDERLSA